MKNLYHQAFFVMKLELQNSQILKFNFKTLGSCNSSSLNYFLKPEEKHYYDEAIGSGMHEKLAVESSKFNTRVHELISKSD
jgi:hypothetical protein